jgi:hypothetical protein
MLDKLTHEDFEKCLNQNFLAEHRSGTVELKLVECRVLPSARRKDCGREPFSILFRGPRQPVLPQSIHTLKGPMGTLDIFIVPVGPDQEGMRYEAIFT